MNCRNCGYQISEGAARCVACGLPVNTPPPTGLGAAGMQQSASPPSWLSRNAKVVIPLGCLGLLLLAGLFVAGVFTLVFSLLRSSEPYQKALERARQNPQVVATLGAPIEPAWYVTGSINQTLDSGKAALSIPISGPKGKATIFVGAGKSAGKWEFHALIVEFEGGRRVDLLEEKSEPRVAPTTSSRFSQRSGELTFLGGVSALP